MRRGCWYAGLVRYPLGFVLLLLACPLPGQEASAARQLRFEYLKPGLLEDRLRLATADQKERGKRLAALMEKAGCAGEQFREQPVSGSKDPNLICRIPASSPEPRGTIVSAPTTIRRAATG